MKVLKSFLLIILSSICIQTIANSKENFFAQGVKLFDQKKYLDSKFKFEQDIVFNPKSEFSYLYLAKIFNKENQDDLEEQNLNVVILLNPKNEEALYLLTLLRIKKSDYDESQELLKKFEKVCNKICDKKAELISKLKSLETN
tara:strand:+ start:875 stop:1303 length:429 start_codon:yes stop_codon:yes gene_type:complete